MITSRQLRLGNLMFDFGGKVVPIISLTNPNAIILETPIPLTEDWLIKLGFTKTAANLNEDPADDITYYDKQHSRHTLRFSYQFGDYLIQFEHDLCDFHVIGDENTVAYVHQLQNLFFSLTGEELKSVF